MKTSKILPVLQKRAREFKRYGYDIPASRSYFLKVSDIRKGKILEIGTGKGHLTACLAKKGLHPVSIDFDPVPLQFAKQHLIELGLAKTVTFRTMNAERLKFASEAFDHVISIDFFHHAKNPFRCLREMSRVAKKTVAIADFNSRGLRLMDRIHHKEGRHHENPKVPFRELGKRLRQNGFTVKTYRLLYHQIFIAKRKEP